MTIEKPIYSLKPSRIYFLVEYFIIFFFLMLYFLLPMLGLQLTSVAVYAIYGIIIFFLVYVETFRRSHQYKISPSQVVIERGIIKKKRDSVFLSSISDVNVQQTYISRFLNFGTISIGPTSGADAIKMLGIWKPKEIALELEKLIHAYEKKKKHEPPKHTEESKK